MNSKYLLYCKKIRELGNILTIFHLFLLYELREKTDILSAIPYTYIL